MGVATLTVIASNADGLINEVFKYSKCNLFGYDPDCEHIRDNFSKYTSPGLVNSTIILLASLSWVNLMFVIQINHIQRAAKWVKACRVFLSSKICGFKDTAN